jgi:NCS1 family nucleobase:cation symporter-1
MTTTTHGQTIELDQLNPERDQSVELARSDEEEEPLLSPRTSTSGPSTRTPHSNRWRHRAVDPNLPKFPRHGHSSQSNKHLNVESPWLDDIMEKVKATRLAHFLDKLAVESEPGLTNAQLMLTNHDLKPGICPCH